MRIRLLVATAITVVALPLLAWTAPAGAAPYCGIYWGSLPKESPAYSQDRIVNLRTGRHTCFDRLVIDLNGPSAGYREQYVPEVLEDGSGFPIPLRGGAFLEVIALAVAHDDDGNPTFTPANRDEAANVAGFRTFRQIAWRGTFEGQTLIGLGVRARLPFRVFALAGPGAGGRLVIDVAHRW